MRLNIKVFFGLLVVYSLITTSGVLASGHPSVSAAEGISSEKLLQDAHSFIRACEDGSIQITSRVAGTLKEFKQAVSELEQNPLSQEAASHFYLQYSWFPKVATVPKGPGGMLNPILEAHHHERREAIRTFLEMRDVSPELLNSSLFIYGDAKWPVLEEVMTGMTDLIEPALRKGCDLNHQSNDDFGNTPLVWSIANDAKESAIELILTAEKLGIPINLDLASRFNGNTPLILSIAKGHERPNEMPNFELTRFLLEHGADPNKPDSDGFTPLHYAFLRRDVKTIQLLLDHGARPDLLNHEGETPLDMMKHPYSFSKTIVFTVTNGNDQDSCSFSSSKGEFENLTNNVMAILPALLKSQK